METKKTVADIKRLREISAELKELGELEEILVELNKWIDKEESRMKQVEPLE